LEKRWKDTLRLMTLDRFQQLFKINQRFFNNIKFWDNYKDLFKKISIVKRAVARGELWPVPQTSSLFSRKNRVKGRLRPVVLR